MSIISDRLILLQEKNNYLKKDIAEKVGVSVMAYYRYESGKRTPTAEVLIEFSKLYNVSVDYLLGLTDSSQINK